MSKQIEIDGKKYKLVPVEEESNVLDDYRVEKKALESNLEPQPVKTVDKGKSKVKRAKPKVYEYREKFKSKTLGPGDFPRVDKSFKPLKQPSVPNDNLLTGPGVEYDGYI